MPSSSNNHTSLFVTLLACIMVIALAMVTAVFIAAGRPTVVVVPPAESSAVVMATPSPHSVQDASQVPAIATPATPTIAPVVDAPTAPTPPRIVVHRVSTAPAADNPLDSRWDGVPVQEIAIDAQQMAPPMLDQASISSVRVQAVRDNQRIVWRMSWRQDEPSRHLNVGQFADAAALQFPMVEGAPFTMGAPGMPVRVLYWKANWQLDVDEGFQTVRDQHPNAWSDMYWFAQNDPDLSMAEAFADDRSRDWLIAYRAGNPMADFERTTPVEELTAEGFGTLTHVPDSPSNARGFWQNGWWTVVIDRPISGSDDPLTERLRSGEPILVALAIWDGARGNVGGRKHITNWIPMEFEP